METVGYEFLEPVAVWPVSDPDSRSVETSGRVYLRTDSLAFGVLLVATALIVGGLSYFPALALGPVIEHLTMSG